MKAGIKKGRRYGNQSDALLNIQRVKSSSCSGRGPMRED